MNKSSDLVAELAKVNIFAGWSERDRKKLSRLMTVSDMPAGREMTREGKDGIGFHLILEGTADVVVGGETRRQLGAGDYFGEVSLIDGKPRTATVVAKTKLRTAGLTAWDFKPVLSENPALSISLLEGLCDRIRRLETMVAEMHAANPSSDAPPPA